MKKQLKWMTKLNFVLIIMLLLSSSFGAYGNTTVVSSDTAGSFLQQLNIFKGYEDGTLGLNRNITRAEFAALTVRLIGMEELQESRKGTTSFKDVKGDFWGSGYINIAVGEGLFKGYDDQTFRPQGNITYAEVITVLVRLLGYEAEVTGTWPQGHIDKATELKINANISYEPSQIVNRGDIAIMIYQALNVVLK